METVYEVVRPGGRRTTVSSSFAKRLDSLEGKTICALWDWIFLGDRIFPMIEKELAKRYPLSKFISYEVFCSTHGGTEASMIATLPEKLKQYKCDAVISGVGC